MSMVPRKTTSPVVIMPAGEGVKHADALGKMLPCCDIRIMNDNGREVAPGRSGELWIAGAVVVPGYWNNPEANAANFTHGYWHSGDIGSIDDDGFVRIFDRKKDMINRAGYKVYSVEVENVLTHHPAVIEAAVVGRPDAVLGEEGHQPSSCRSLRLPRSKKSAPSAPSACPITRCRIASPSSASRCRATLPGRC